MLQRLLYGVVKTGIETIQANMEIIDDIFSRDYELEAEEVTAIKEYFTNSPPTVINGYANKATTFPAIAITLAQETEIEHVLGGVGGQVVTVGDSLLGADIDSTIWEHKFQIYVYAEHHDVAAYYYEITKSILTAGEETFINDGQYDFHFSGMELAPDPAYLPEHLFVRQITFECKREFQRIDRDSLLGKAYQVSGIHIDSSGSPGDVGEVDTLVIPYSED